KHTFSGPQAKLIGSSKPTGVISWVMVSPWNYSVLKHGSTTLDNLSKINIFYHQIYPFGPAYI
ncbi:MAG: hypothetical protein R6V15_15065, partial [Desulfotignum sp.]